MSTTETLEMPPTPPAPPVRRLRRSRTDKVGAGVAGGLGEYFGVDPVLFRVLFATAAFFGGAGILAYLLAWVAIPEQGTEQAAIDGWIGGLRRRRVPVWLVAVAGVVLLWVVAFSWWAPGPFVPVVIVAALVILAVGRRGRRPAAAPAVDLTKRPDGAPSPDAVAHPAPNDPAWLRETKEWVTEARAASRERARRAFPIKLATLLVWGAALGVLAAIDAVSGVALPLYFLASTGIIVAGLAVGIASRRTPWSISALLVPSIVGLVAFAGTHARLHDGMGDRQWKPTGTASSQHYRLAFGRGVLDLRSLGASSATRTIRVDMAAGQVKILAPRALNLTVRGNVHFGNITVGGAGYDSADGKGVNVGRTIDPPRQATGPRVVVDVHLADGNLDLERS